MAVPVVLGDIRDSHNKEYHDFAFTVGLSLMTSFLIVYRENE